jgi:hypothetical protein
VLFDMIQTKSDLEKTKQGLVWDDDDLCWVPTKQTMKAQFNKVNDAFQHANLRWREGLDDRIESKHLFSVAEQLRQLADFMRRGRGKAFASSLESLELHLLLLGWVES